MMAALLWICVACNRTHGSQAGAKPVPDGTPVSGAVQVSDATPIPKVDRVFPLEDEPFHNTSDVFFTENFENPKNFKHPGNTENSGNLEDSWDLNARFHDTGGTENGLMRISDADAFSGTRAAHLTYVAKKNFPEGDDPGSAGWFWYFFGDNDLEGYPPIADTLTRTRLYARWYHKFEEGFSSQEGTGTLPPKMARMRCFDKTWRANYTVLFWIEGTDGHISIQQHTRAPGVEREWLPNYNTSFSLNDPGNIGRWIHFELGVTLGEGHHSDRVQAWADGKLICDIDKQDLAGGYRENTLNGMSWDCYWNGGAPRAQSRFYDDLVLSDSPIGPVRTDLTPCIKKAAYGSEYGKVLKEWQVEVAQTLQKPMSISEPRRKEPEMEYITVWQGKVSGKTDTVSVNSVRGTFTGPLSGSDQLEYNTLYSVRLRQRVKKTGWSEWSEWHSAFSTLWMPGPDSIHDRSQDPDPDAAPGSGPAPDPRKGPPEGYLTGHMIN